MSGLPIAVDGLAVFVGLAWVSVMVLVLVLVLVLWAGGTAMRLLMMGSSALVAAAKVATRRAASAENGRWTILMVDGFAVVALQAVFPVRVSLFKAQMMVYSSCGADGWGLRIR